MLMTISPAPASWAGDKNEIRHEGPFIFYAGGGGRGGATIRGGNNFFDSSAVRLYVFNPIIFYTSYFCDFTFTVP